MKAALADAEDRVKVALTEAQQTVLQANKEADIKVAAAERKAVNLQTQAAEREAEAAKDTAQTVQSIEAATKDQIKQMQLLADRQIKVNQDKLEQRSAGELADELNNLRLEVADKARQIKELKCTVRYVGKQGTDNKPPPADEVPLLKQQVATLEDQVQSREQFELQVHDMMQLCEDSVQQHLKRRAYEGFEQALEAKETESEHAQMDFAQDLLTEEVAAAQQELTAAVASQAQFSVDIHMLRDQNQQQQLEIEQLSAEIGNKNQLLDELEQLRSTEHPLTPLSIMGVGMLDHPARAGNRSRGWSWSSYDDASIPRVEELWDRVEQSHSVSPSDRMSEEAAALFGRADTDGKGIVSCSVLKEEIQTDLFLGQQLSLTQRESFVIEMAAAGGVCFAPY